MATATMARSLTCASIVAYPYPFYLVPHNVLWLYLLLKAAREEP